MNLKRLFLASLTLVLVSTSVLADEYRITSDPGGSLSQYADQYRTMQANGTRVVIDGDCNSACTSVTIYVDRARVCVTPNARMGFHSAYEPLSGVYDKQASYRWFNSYPSFFKKVLSARGWHGQNHPNLIVLGPETLTRYYRYCK